MNLRLFSTLALTSPALSLATATATDKHGFLSRDEFILGGKNRLPR